MSFISGWFDRKRRDGFKITFFSTGRMFNPRYQKRTDPIKDIMAKDEQKDRKMFDKMFSRPIKWGRKKPKRPKRLRGKYGRKNI